ncbi:MAG: HAD family hydrolase [Candidatus Gastranaerophilales bacterium]|nr:HAD family hydrolase [Candidatus Gastranaerophilales bacterium]
MTNLKSAVFFDRDGTLIYDAHYLKDKKDLKLFEKTAKAIKKLNENNILTILISNQSGVARGYFDENTVNELNEYLNHLLKQENAHLDGFYFCPHHIKGSIEKYSVDCDCRKPKIGMINQALKDFKNIDMTKSYIVGDKECDINMAKNADLKSILVQTGYGNKDKEICTPNYVAKDIEDAIDWILKDILISK